MSEHNPNVPHQAVIPLRAEIMERMPTGHVTGRPVEKLSHVFTVFGNNFEDCKQRTQNFIEAIRRLPSDVVEAIQEESALEEHEQFLVEELERTRKRLAEIKDGQRD